jgi:hypothetical protein
MAKTLVEKVRRKPNANLGSLFWREEKTTACKRSTFPKTHSDTIK